MTQSVRLTKRGAPLGALHFLMVSHQSNLFPTCECLREGQRLKDSPQPQAVYARVATQCVGTPIALARSELNLKTEGRQLCHPPHLRCPKLGSLQVGQEVIVSKDGERHTKQIVTKLVYYSPFQGE